ncbi:MAG: hypothetical protein Q7T89_19820 [Anaerolineales bacterium]|nr:hypothetical protein [Anaerolineales bacterium]
MDFIKKQLPIFEIGLVTAILSIHLYAAFSDAYNFPNAWFMRDDAYYYFKVAQNITEGLGSTFDGINLTNGYHPLWMVICIPIFALARFDLILPLRILLMVMAGFNAATAVLIYRLVKNNLSHAVAILAASFWAFNLYIHTTVYEPGLETPLAAFAIVLFIYKLSQFEKEWRTSPVATRQVVTLAISATIVMFSRLDLVFLAVIGGIWVIFRGKPIRSLLPLDILIIFASMTSSVALRTGIDQYNTTYAASAIEAVILVLIIKVIALYFFGAYQHPRASSVLKTIRQTGLALTVSSILALGLYLLLVQLGFGKGFPRTAFVIDWGISLVLILALRLSARFAWFSDPKIKVGAQTITPLAELKTHWKKWLTEGVTYYGILGGALALYMLYNKITFGTSTPVSGQVKRWWGTLIDTVYESPAPNWSSFFGISFQPTYNAWQPASSAFLWLGRKIYSVYPGSNTLDERYYISMFAFALLALVILFANARRAREVFSNMALIPLAAGCGIQILSYTTSAYGGVKEWYWISQMVFSTLAGSVLLDMLLRPLQRLLTRTAKPARFTLELASIALGLFLAYEFGIYVKSAMRYNYYPADRPYMEVLPFIEANTKPGDIIGMTGGGNTGYFIHDRTIVNMDGLINSYDYFHALQNGEAPGYLSQRGITIIFASPGLLSLPPYNGQFAPYLENYSEYGGKKFMYLLEKQKY